MSAQVYVRTRYVVLASAAGIALAELVLGRIWGATVVVVQLLSLLSATLTALGLHGVAARQTDRRARWVWSLLAIAIGWTALTIVVRLTGYLVDDPVTVQRAHQYATITAAISYALAVCGLVAYLPLTLRDLGNALAGLLHATILTGAILVLLTTLLPFDALIAHGSHWVAGDVALAATLGVLGLRYLHAANHPLIFGALAVMLLIAGNAIALYARTSYGYDVRDSYVATAPVQALARGLLLAAGLATLARPLRLPTRTTAPRDLVVWGGVPLIIGTIALAWGIVAAAPAWMLILLLLGSMAQCGLLLHAVWHSMERVRQAEAHERTLRSVTNFCQHELRTYAASMRGMTQVLRPYLTPDDAPLLDDMDDLTTQVDGVMEMLLLISHHGVVRTVAVQPLTSYDVLTPVLRDPHLIPHHVRVVQDVAAITIWCDPFFVSMALRTAIRNAIEAMPIATAPHTLTIRVLAEQGRTLLRIEDSGMGFAPTVLAAVADGRILGRSTKATGSGLGLALVQYVAQQHQGSVAIGNLPGRGAWLQIVLPAAAAHTAQSAPTVQRAEQPA